MPAHSGRDTFKLEALEARILLSAEGGGAAVAPMQEALAAESGTSQQIYWDEVASSNEVGSLEAAQIYDPAKEAPGLFDGVASEPVAPTPANHASPDHPGSDTGPAAAADSLSPFDPGTTSPLEESTDEKDPFASDAVLPTAYQADLDVPSESAPDVETTADVSTQTDEMVETLHAPNAPPEAASYVNDGPVQTAGAHDPELTEAIRAGLVDDFVSWAYELTDPDALGRDLPLLGDQLFATIQPGDLLGDLFTPLSSGSFSTLQNLSDALDAIPGIQVLSTTELPDQFELELRIQVGASDTENILPDLSPIDFEADGPLGAQVDLDFQLTLGSIYTSQADFYIRSDNDLLYADASVTGAVLPAEARLGFVDIHVSNMTPAMSGRFTLDLVDPGTGAADGLIDAGELAQTPVGTLAQTTLQEVVPASFDATFTSELFPDARTLELDWPDLATPDTVNENLALLGGYEGLATFNIEDVDARLTEFAAWVGLLNDPVWLGRSLPVFGNQLQDAVNIEGLLAGRLVNRQPLGGPAPEVTDAITLRDRLTAVGGVEGLTMELLGGESELRYTFDLSISESRPFTFTIHQADLDLELEPTLNLEVTFFARLAFGFDLTTGEFFVVDDSSGPRFSISAEHGEEAFSAAGDIGFLSVNVTELTDAVAVSETYWLADPQQDGRITADDMALGKGSLDELSFSISGAAELTMDIECPLLGLSPVTFSGEWPDLSNPESYTANTYDFAEIMAWSKVESAAFSDGLKQLAGFMGAMAGQDLGGGNDLQIPVPLFDLPLADLLDFTDLFDELITQYTDPAFDPNGTIDEAFRNSRQLLALLENPSLVGADSASLAISADDLRYTVSLQDRTLTRTGLAFHPGVDAQLALDIDGEMDFLLDDIDVEIVFGVDRQTGRFFIEETGLPLLTATGSVIADINDTTEIGFLEVDITNGTATLSVSVQVTLTDSGADSPATPGLITDTELLTADAANLVQLAVSGTTGFALPMSADVGTSSYSGVLTATWADLLDPDTFVLDTSQVDDMLAFRNIAPADVLAGLLALPEYLEHLHAPDKLGSHLGLVGANLGGGVTLAGDLYAALDGMEMFGTAQGLETVLSAALGSPVSVWVDGTTNDVQIEFGMIQALSIPDLWFSIDEEIPGEFVGLQLSGTVALTGTAGLALRMGISLGEGVAADERVYIITDTTGDGVVSRVSMWAEVDATGVDASGSLGHLPITITGGTVQVAAESGGLPDPGHDATVFLDLGFGTVPGADRMITVAEMWDDPGAALGSPAVSGAVQVVLPISAPGVTPGQGEEPQVTIVWSDLGQIAASSIAPQDLAPYLAAAANFNADTALTGIQAVYDLIGAWSTLDLVNTPVPFLDVPISSLFDFSGLGASYFSAVASAGFTTAGTFHTAVLNGISLAGLDPLQVTITADPNGNTSEHDPGAGRFRYLIDFEYLVTAAPQPFVFVDDLFSFDDVTFTPNVTFDMELEFGLNEAAGFFVVDRGIVDPQPQPYEVRVHTDFGASLDGKQGEFGPLIFGVSSVHTGIPGVVDTDFTLNIDLVDPHPSSDLITVGEMTGAFNSVVLPALAGSALLDMSTGMRLGEPGAGLDSLEHGPGVVSRFQTHWLPSRPDIMAYGPPASGSLNPVDGFEPFRYVYGDWMESLVGWFTEQISYYNPVAEDLLEILTEEIPVVGMTPLELLYGSTVPEPLALLLEIVDVYNSIPTQFSGIDLSSYLPAYETAPLNAVVPTAQGGNDPHRAEYDTFLANLQSYGVEVPVLPDISPSLGKILFGEIVEFMRFDPGEFRWEYTFDSEPIPMFSYGIPGVADIHADLIFGGHVALVGHVSVHFTSRGVTMDLNSDGVADRRFRAGMGIGDNLDEDGNDELEVGLEFRVYAGVQGSARILGFDIARVTGKFIIDNTIGIDLADTKFDPGTAAPLIGLTEYARVGFTETGGDGIVYFDEMEAIETTYSLRCLLTPAGKVEAGLGFAAEIQIPIVGWVTIFEGEFLFPIADFEFAYCAPVEADLAYVSGNELIMHQDSAAPEEAVVAVYIRRDHQNMPTWLRVTKVYGNSIWYEDFPITGNPGAENYAGHVTSITAEGTNGNDEILLSEELTQVNVYGQSEGETVPNPVHISTLAVNARDGNDYVEFGSIDPDNSYLNPLAGTVVHAGTGNDTVLGTFASDILHGEDGDDQLSGYDGDDILSGADGNDLLGGGKGDDKVYGNGGADRLFGHEGDDLIQGGNDADEMYGCDGDDRLEGGHGNDFIVGGNGRDIIYDGAGDDLVSAGSENDFIYNGSGTDDIEGNEGDDYIEVGTGGGRVFGRAGNDLVVQIHDGHHALTDTTITGVSTKELHGIERVWLVGGPADSDFDVSGWTGAARIDGGSGTDRVVSHNDTDFVLSDWNLERASGGSFYLENIEEALLDGDPGSSGDNHFEVSSWTGMATLVGGAGLDRVLSTNNADFTLTDVTLSRSTGGSFWLDGVERATLTGLLGHNSLDASAFSGQAQLYGGEGNDTLRGGSGDDFLDGGKGTDNLYGNGGNDELIGGGGVGDDLDGGAGDDILRGSNDGADVMDGGSGHDRLFGYGGNDLILCGSGDDVAEGGAGDDTISGEAGSDLLVGGADHDLLYGHSASGAGEDLAVDYLYGDFGTNGDEAGSGRDQLHGNGGNDFLFGEAEDDLIVSGGQAGDRIDYGSGESGTPSDFVTPSPTASPAVDPPTGVVLAEATLPTGVDYAGRWAELASSATGPGVSGDPALSTETDLAVSGDSVYVVWVDNRTGYPEIYLARYTESGGWEELAGSASDGGLSRLTGTARRPTITLNSAGLPVVAWTQITPSGSAIYAAEYDPAAQGGSGGWVALGTSMSAGGLSNTTSADDARIVTTTLGPVVAWLDSSTGPANMYARVFNGANWVVLGAGSASGAGVSGSATAVSDLALATDGVAVAGAWTQDVSGKHKIYLKEYRGGSWGALAGSASGNGVSDNAENNRTASLAYRSGALFVAWQSDANQGSREIYAARFNGVGFVSAGPGANTGGGVSHSSGEAYLPQLASNGSDLVLVWIENRIANETGNTHAVYALNWNGGVFVEELPGDAAYRGIAPGADPVSLALDVDPAGRPFAAWEDVASGRPEISVRANRFVLGTVYYVNDNEQRADTVTTAVGGAWNNGQSPATPKSHVQDVLDTYDLEPGDVILVDAGRYEGSILVDADDAEVLILGAPYVTAILEGDITVLANGVVLRRLEFYNADVKFVNTAGGALIDTVIMHGGVIVHDGSDVQVVHNVVTAQTAGISLSGGVSDAVVEHNLVLDGAVGLRLYSAGAVDVVLRGNRVRGSQVGLELASASSGLIRGNDLYNGHLLGPRGLSIVAPFTGLITENKIHGWGVGVDYDAAAALSRNRIWNNLTGVSASVGGVVDAFGFVGDTEPNRIFDNTFGVQLSGRMQGQHVYRNATGVLGTGFLGGENLDHANLIESNATGLNVTGTIQFNRISRNGTGVRATSGQLIANNVIYRNQNCGVLANSVSDVRIVHNTFYAPAGDNIRVESGSRTIEVRNNILWAESGYNLYVQNHSQSGFFSDYNDLHVTGTGKIGYWTKDFTDLLDWQADIARFDLHSIGATVVNPHWSTPRFLNASLDNYRVFDLLARQRFSSPTVDAGDPLVDAAVPVEHINRLVNAGFESGMTGWTSHAEGTTGTAGIGAYEGSAYFLPGDSTAGFAEQAVDLLAAGYSAAELDGEDLAIVFGGRVRSAAEDPWDRGALVLIFLDASLVEISRVTAESSNPVDRWELLGDRVILPQLTRSVMFRFEATLQGHNDNESFLDAAFLYVLDESEAPDQGAYGNLPAEDLGATVQNIALRFPDLYTDWEKHVPHTIRWDSFSNDAESLIRIELLQDTPDGPAPLLTIDPSATDDGAYAWTPDDDGIDFGTHGLRIQVSVFGNETLFDRSAEPFSVPEDGSVYWVDDGSNANDEYTPSAIGNNRHTGKRAAAPKPNPVNVLRVYDLTGGDTLNVDTGLYPLIDNVMLSSNPEKGVGQDEGFLFRGPLDTNKVAELEAAIPGNISQALVELDDADFVTLQHFTIRHAKYGVWAHNDSLNLDASYLVLSGHVLDGFRYESDAPTSTFHHIVSYDNGYHGIYVNGDIAGVTDSEAYGNAQSGLYVVGPGDSVFEANTIYENEEHGIYVSNGVGTAVVGHGNLGLDRGNLVYNNGDDPDPAWDSNTSGIRADGDVLVLGNTVFGHTTGDTGITTTGWDSVASHNVVYSNYDGMSGYGMSGNRVYNNLNTGITSSGRVVELNVVYSNVVGIHAHFSAGVLRNNLVYENQTVGILVDHGGYHPGPEPIEIVNNTVYQAGGGDAVIRVQQSVDVVLRNNILWADGAYALDVSADSQVGFQSDFNVFHLTNGGRVALWQGLVKATLPEWRTTAFTDADSIAGDPLFVDASGTLGYVNPSDDGRNDDFHVQSLYGSFHGGAWAPVRDAGTGLPALLTAAETVDAFQSPAIDRGDSADVFANEPTDNGAYINIGAYGNTAQASKSPAQYVLVTRPNGGEVAPALQDLVIRWRSHDLLGTVDIDLMEIGNPTPVTSIATGVANDGELIWNVPATVTPGTEYLVRVTRGTWIDDSKDPFTITEEISVYYVNDGSVNAMGDWTTAPGNDTQDGLTPATPKASIAAVLQFYDLGAGDTILVDDGDYLLTINISLVADDSGVTIEGYHAAEYPDRRALLDRSNTSSGSYVFQFSGGEDVTVSHIHMINAYRGIYASGSADSDGMHISNCTIYDHYNAGIHIETSNEDALLVGNRVYGQSRQPERGIYIVADRGQVIGNDIFGATTGIYAGRSGNRPREEWTEIISNTVHQNVSGGIFVNYGGVAMIGNEVYGHRKTSGSTGIYATATYGAEVIDNVVHDNGVGIQTGNYGSPVVTGNRVFNNRVGISGHGRIEENRIYNNAEGLVFGAGAARNNILSGHTGTGIRINSGSGSIIENNTIHQAQGWAVEVHLGDHFELRDNIFRVSGGHVIYVGPSSDGIFISDYNLFDLSGGTVKVGQLEGTDFDTLAGWTFGTGNDTHSFEADPQFVSPTGADGVMGFSEQSVGTASIVDDGDPGFTLAGSWQSVVSVDGYGGDYYETVGSDTTRYAEWTFTGLIPGEYYQVAITYPSSPTSYHSNRLWVYDGEVSAFNKSYGGGQFNLDQRIEPDDFFDAGSGWKIITVMPVTYGTLTVHFEADYPGLTPAEADAVRVQPVEGDMGADDDFHLQPASPAIDQGDPAAHYLAEPVPNGGRVNIGAYGNTVEATLGPAAFVQVLAPNGAEKYELGESVGLAWGSSGLGLTYPIATINTGHFDAGAWSRDRYRVDGSTLRESFIEPVDTSAVTDPAPGAVYQNVLRADYGAGVSFAYSLPVPDGAYVLRLHFAEYIGHYTEGSRVFDIQVQGVLEADDYDIYAEVGAAFKAAILEIPVVATGSEGIGIELINTNSIPAALAGIEILAANPGGSAAPTVDLEVSTDNGSTWTPIASGVAVDHLGRGSLPWTAGPVTGGQTGRIRVSATGGLEDVSDEPFTIANDGPDYYVNDASTADDVFTTAIGDDQNGGKTPATPMGSLFALLAAYDLEPGDVVHLDTGHYLLVRNLVIGVEDEGVTIMGPAGAGAVLDRDNLLDNNAYAFELAGADDVTLRRLTVVGARYGIYAANGADSDRLTVSECVFTSDITGIYLDTSNDDALIDDNELSFCNAGMYARGFGTIIQNNKIFGGGTGIEVINYDAGQPTHIRGNTLSNNQTGIIAQSVGAWVEDNVVFRHTTGILLKNDSQARGNTAYGNGTGIDGYGLIQGNRVFDNSVYGIRGYGDAYVVGNTAYGNDVGILGEGGTRFGLVNNLVYANDRFGILIQGADIHITPVLNNTVYQVDGDALRIEDRSELVDIRNNIFWVANGAAISVAVDSQADITSDFNLFQLGAGGQLGSWGGTLFTDREIWFYELGLDADSTVGDPMFVNPAGTDGVLGFTEASFGSPRIIDDGDAGFSTSGSITFEFGTGGFGNDYQVLGEDSEANWVIDGLTPGAYVDIAATWVGHYQNDWSIPYEIWEGEKRLEYTTVNQRSDPVGWSYAGVSWQMLGRVIPSGTELVVKLATGSYNDACADAVLVQQLRGDLGGDDDFHVYPASPAVDQGDPDTYYLEEPHPNGQRANQGAFGNTAEATASPAETLQVISPNGLEKYESGQSVTVQWQTSNFSTSRTLGLMNVGGDTRGNWLYERYALTSYSASVIEEPIALGGLSEPALEEVYQSLAYAPSGAGNRLSYLLPLPAGDYEIRLHFAEHNYTAPGNRMFDILLQNVVHATDYDIYAEAGDRYAAVSVQYNATVLDSEGLALDLISKTASAVLAGIEILAANPGGINQPVADILLSTDLGANWTVLASDVAMDRFERGAYLWNAGPETNGNEALIKVTAEGTRSLADLSDRPFTIANNGTDYYVNDGSTSGDVFTNVPGDNAADGKTPNTPMSSLAALLLAYDLDAGDVVHVDHGVYTLLANIPLLADDSGIYIEGPDAGTAVMDRNNLVNGIYAFELRGANDVTLDRLSITGAYVGIFGGYNTESSGLTVTRCEIYGNDYNGIQLNKDHIDTHILNNKVHDSGQGIVVYGNDSVIEGNEIYSQGTGIVQSVGWRVTIQGNEVYGHDGAGIRSSGNEVMVVRNSVHDNSIGIDADGRSVLVVENDVYGHTTGWGLGIELDDGADATGNTVHGNLEGIRISDENSWVEGNRVYNNSEEGIKAQYPADIVGNFVYTNSIGIHVQGASRVNNNLVYDNTNYGIYLYYGQSARVYNNTVFQRVGDAIRVDNYSTSAILRSNILWVLSGYDIYVSSNSQSNLDSDYNLFHRGPDPNAHAGYWGSANQHTLADWQAASGQDGGSGAGDPLFVDMDGADDVLGYDPAGDGYDGGPDDNFYLGQNSAAIDRGDTELGPDLDIEGFGRVDDPGTANGGSPVYEESTTPDSIYVGGVPTPVGTAQGWNSNDSYWNLALPFDFEFYGTTWNSVYVTSNGLLQFGSTSGAWSGYNNASGLQSTTTRITALWDDLNTVGTGHDIYIDNSTADQFIIRWSAYNAADLSEVNMAVSLFDDGTIRFDYGPGNTNLTPTVGISAGDRLRYLLSMYDEATTLTEATSVLFVEVPGFVDIGAYEYRGSSLDVVAPQVLSTMPVEVGTGGVVSGPVSEITLVFSEEMNPIDAGAKANYVLRSAGSNSLFDDGDDLLFDLSPSFALGGDMVILAVVDGILPAGLYRLTASGTGTLHDVSGLALDGEGGSPASDYVRIFQIGHAEPVVVSMVIEDGLVQRSRIEQIDIQFNVDVGASLQPGDLQLQNVTLSGPINPADMAVSYDGGTNTATFTFPGLVNGRLPDGNYEVLVAAADVEDGSGTPLTADFSDTFHALAGDVDGDRVINDVDLYAVWQNLLVDAGSRDPNGDLNGDGEVDMSDVQVIMGNYLSDLPLPIPLPALGPAFAESDRLVSGLDQDIQVALPAALATSPSWSASLPLVQGGLYPWWHWSERFHFEVEEDEEERPALLHPGAPGDDVGAAEKSVKTALMAVLS